MNLVKEIWQTKSAHSVIILLIKIIQFQVRYSMFGKSKGHENVPPTSDAFNLHIKRSHYQALI